MRLMRLSVAGGSSDNKIDRHPERRFKAAYAKFEERRLKEMEDDGTGAHLRLNQRKEKLRKEFEKSPENPFNQLSAIYNASRDEISDLRTLEKAEGGGQACWPGVEPGFLAMLHCCKTASAYALLPLLLMAATR